MNELTVRLADKAEGRTISLTFEMHLVPPPGQKLGECEAAGEAGDLLMARVAWLLRGVCEAEGFTVRLRGRQVVY